MTLEALSEHGCFGGVQGFYRHDSAVIGLPMRFSVFRPPQAATEPVPVLYYLAGLTCTEETFMIKAGAQRRAAELGIMLVACDTSARDTGINGATGDWEFGEGAGFYLDATQAPWSRHFRMNRYVSGELRELVESRFPANGRRGIFGHSMGGHGALTLALRHPDLYRSVSAFAPICAPADCPWGQKAFPRYLGEDRAQWNAHDASRMMLARGSALVDEILIDQGLADQFLHAGQLLPERFEQACVAAGQPLQLRRHDGYDHGYYFIASFIDDHLDWHHARLRA
jgi:S-formylglutathione hydrolase